MNDNGPMAPYWIPEVDAMLVGRRLGQPDELLSVGAAICAVVDRDSFPRVR